MIVYFADRHLNILGQATTHLPEGVRISDDLKTEDVETGVSIFECDIHFDRKTRAKVSEWAKVGNYILRNSGNEIEFYNIIDSKKDTKKQKVYIYAEDDGLDLLNDVVGAYEADEYHPISYYVERFATDAGWEIGINEVEGLTRKLSWNSAQTASARLLSIAEAFNNCELSYSFEIKGLQISKKYINIYEERGKDTGIQLRLNKEIDSIITTESIANLATALRATGGTPENSDEPITLLGYEYDDGNFYVDGEVLKSRKALESWSRYLWKDDEAQQLGGHITKEYSFDTTSQAVLCEKTITELKKVCDMEINYEADISNFPENVKIGDRVDIIDDEGELYLSSRVLILETSETEGTRKATLGEHLIKRSGISSQVAKLAENFAKQTVSVKNATKIAANARAAATEAKAQVDAAIKSVEDAHRVVQEVVDVVDTAKQSAAAAQTAANEAQRVVDEVETRIGSLETTVATAQQAAEGAHQAAETATEKAEEAKAAAKNAEANATGANLMAEDAKKSAANATARAEAAINAANKAKTEAAQATETAIAAKLDAKKAEDDVAALDDELNTVKDTMKVDYARKTELTETTAELQTQISRNAAEVESTAYKLMVIDETANNAVSKLEAAQRAATLAQQQADEATAEATAAQQAADNALAAANDAQAEADTARAAYKTAKSVADEAEAALLAARKDLETVSARADATEEEITAAQVALTAAQTVADAAMNDADAAALIAENALNVVIEAVANADKAQAAANDAVKRAALAQATADEARGNANKAKAIVDEAMAIAEEAQATANTAKANADTTQAAADNALSVATEAQAIAADAQVVLEQANADLEAAQSRLAEVLANVDATAEDVEAAQADVDTAQAAVNEAKASADAAQATADNAKADAEAAQTAADLAKASADEAQSAADESQKAADIAKGYVYALEKRTVEAEASIKQNAEELKLKATKTEVAETLGGYYTKAETDSAISVESDKISASVEEVKTSVEDNEEIIAKANSLIEQLAESIKTLVVGANGESLMTQSESGWKYDIATLLDTVNNHGSKLANYDDYVEITTYDGEPCIRLGEKSTDFKVLITNKRILFQEGSATPTYIFDNTLVTENIEVKEELKQGGFVWKVRSNGNYGLMWKGVNA